MRLKVVHLICHFLLDVENGFEQEWIVLGREGVKLGEEARSDETSIIEKGEEEIVVFVVVLQFLFSLFLVVGETLHV